ncbi:MAG TPA: sugar kinase, partial [Phycisphaerales bacterium]|nr:sugar kinase [Phycisphaerales bacterium]
MSALPKRYLGMDIGGTKCAVTLGTAIDGRMSIQDKESFKTASTRTPLQTLRQLLALSDKMINRHKLKPQDITSIGLSCGGPLDSQSGTILSPPNLPGWDDVAIVKLIVDHLGIQTYLQNDANACALAEWLWGAGNQCDNMIFLTFGTGMGAGLILNGHLYTGTNDMAGEVGHMRLEDTGPLGYNKPGSFEGFCSGGGLAIAAKGIGLQLSAQEVFEKAAQGDQRCVQLVEQMGKQLGRGLAILIDLLNPQKIILGSIFNRQESIL